MHIFVMDKSCNGLTLPYISGLLHPSVPAGAPGQLIGCSRRHRGPSSSSDPMEVFLSLAPKSGTTSHNRSDFQIFHVQTHFCSFQPNVGLCSCFRVFIVLRSLNCIYVLLFGVSAFFLFMYKMCSVCKILSF